MFEDEYFVEVVRKEWAALQNELPTFQARMSSVADSISEEQIANFEKWQILGWPVSVGLVYFGTWEKEVEYVESFFASRVEWLDSYLDALP